MKHQCSKFIFLLFVAGFVHTYKALAQLTAGKVKARSGAQKTAAKMHTSQPVLECGIAPFYSHDSTRLPDSLVAYAKTLIGVPYMYASVDPKVGFDCSGFITYVFKHFNLAVPRSSVDFTNYGHEIPNTETRQGDLILFTGTDSTVRVVGHMGIIVENSHGEILFIHSSSGTANGVVITPLNQYYKGRFVKTIRVFKALEKA
jgi:cell wall-associated NlpC family hydrolase